MQNVLFDEARERGVPCICISGTFGGWGGIVARLNHRPGSGCWWCFQAALDNTIPTPLADPHGGVQPPGCNHITYIGANTDLMEIALQGVRLATTTLIARSGNSDMDYPWDVAVVNLRAEDGRRIVPTWTTYVLPKSPSCPVCST